MSDVTIRTEMRVKGNAVSAKDIRRFMDGLKADAEIDVSFADAKDDQVTLVFSSEGIAPKPTVQNTHLNHNHK